MPRLTWNQHIEAEVRAAREAFNLYTRHKFIARHNPSPSKPDLEFTVREFRKECSPLEFKPMPSAFDKIMKEVDPWES